MGLRPARALRLRGRKVPKPTTVTRFPLATFSTIASKTAFTASPAAALLRFPAFAATCTRSDFVTTCGILFPPRLSTAWRIVSKRKWKDNELAHASGQSIYDYAQRRIHHATTAHARCARARLCGICHAGSRTDHAHLLELGPANTPLDDLAGELGRRSREGHRRARQVPGPAQSAGSTAGNI